MHQTAPEKSKGGQLKICRWRGRWADDAPGPTSCLPFEHLPEFLPLALLHLVVQKPLNLDARDADVNRKLRLGRTILVLGGVGGREGVSVLGVNSDVLGGVVVEARLVDGGFEGCSRHSVDGERERWCERC